MASEEKVLATAELVLVAMLALMGAIAAASLVGYAMAPGEYNFGARVAGWQRASPAVFVAANAFSIAALIAGTLLKRSRLPAKPRAFVLCALAFLSLLSFG